MAPEFFPIICLMCLTVASSVVVIAAVICFWPKPRRSADERPSGLRAVRRIVLLAMVGTMVPPVIVGYVLIREYALNEPLVAAARSGDFDQVRTLLDWGASPDSRGVDGAYPALVLAAEAGLDDIVELLLRRGADPEIRGGSGRSALDYARKNGHREVESLLIGYGARE